MTVRTERIGQVLVIRMDRPHKRNAIDAEMTLGLDRACNELDDDPALRVAVLTGIGPVFSAGVDLRTGPGDATDRGGELGVVRRERGKPLIAAVEGAALGGGMELVLACDLIVATRSARFGLPELSRGLVPSCGGLFRARRALPLNIAKQILLTGDSLTAERAYQLGLVNILTVDGAAEQESVNLAQRICRNAPVSVHESLRAVERLNSADDAVAWRITDEAVAAAFASPDKSEGVAAFLERRAPRWTGA
ncbi:enoyl-CoA hydratase-related protein [Nocardia sp. CA-135398]|uniref:enoyl-CoA hydratase-related protein n=1 Tax=Nocardia sp. CA-135398 TaxID=3239977 RepID=UPI003D99BFA7